MRPNLIALVSLAAAPLSAQHAPELLFNGSDLAGWHGQRHFSPYKLAEMSDEARMLKDVNIAANSALIGISDKL